MKKQKTYAETRGKKPFDWNRFLAKKKFTDDELMEADELAGNWVTCACGNQCSIIPRVKGHYKSAGEPKDYQLYELGLDFSHAVSDMAQYYGGDTGGFEEARDEAIQTLAVIEKRSAVLIAQILKKKNAQ